MARTGRPLKQIDVEQLKKLARIGCTHEEMADILGCTRKTIANRFSHEIAIARAEGKKSLRRAQFIAAVKKYQPQMLVHLGKHWLGQSDKAPPSADLDDVTPHDDSGQPIDP